MQRGNSQQYKPTLRDKRNINNLNFHLKQLGKGKNAEVSKRKEIIKIREEISEKEMNQIQQKINKTKIWFFEKINKIDKLLARLIKKKKGEESNQ